MLWLVLLLVALVAGGWLWFGSSSTDSNKPAGPGGMMRGGFAMEAVPVSLYRLQPGRFVEQVKALGTVEAWSTAQVTSQVSGILQKLHFAEGQQVGAGSLLAELDARPYQAALLQAEGSLQETRAQLAQAEGVVRQQLRPAGQEVVALQDFCRRIADHIKAVKDVVGVR